MDFVNKKGITRTGNKTNIFDKALCKRIRERLKLDKEELPDRVIRDVIRLSNTLIGTWVIDNPEGYMMEVGLSNKKPMGVLATSKHLPKEFREDKEDRLAHIQTIKVSEQYRQQVFKRYNVDIGHTIDYGKLQTLGELIPHLNLSTYFYKYKVMWFNHRNCKSKKARSYIFKANRQFNKTLADNVWGGKDYYEWNFNDFYKYKIKSDF